MAKLSDIQQHFQNYLMHNEQSTFADDVVNDDRVGNITRMQVYYAGYRLRLYEALMQDFPKVLLLMGEDDFQKAFLLYLDAFPSEHFSVRYFGRHFIKFLCEHPNYSNQPQLNEMARFEWLIGETLDAPDATPINTAQLQAIDPNLWGAQHFSLHPSLRHHTFCFNTAQSWLVMDKSKSIADIKKLNSPQTWLFWRKGLQALFESCSNEEALILSGIQQKLSFGEVCDACLPFLPEDQIPVLAAQTLFKWIEQEMIVLENKNTAS